jgi:tetratricopeptide (TPR) repeat protein
MNNFLVCSKQALRAQEEGKYSLAYNLLSKTLSLPGIRKCTKIKIEIRMAECLLNSGNSNACWEHLKRLQEKYKNSAICLHEIGNFYYHISEHKKALNHFELAKKINPSLLTLYDSISRLYIDINRYSDAIKILQHALRVEKPVIHRGVSPAYIYLQLALCYFYIEDYKESQMQFQNAESLDDTKIYDWDIYGRCMLQLGDYEKALVCFDRSLLEICSNDYDVFLLKAKAHVQMGQFTEAMRLIRIVKKEIGEILIFPADLKFYAPLIASGFMTELGAILVEE